MKADNEAQEARKATGLSQSEFAWALDIPVGTIRNWEQSRRALTGPAKALMQIIKEHPYVVPKP